VIVMVTAPKFILKQLKHYQKIHKPESKCMSILLTRINILNSNLHWNKTTYQTYWITNRPCAMVRSICYSMLIETELYLPITLMMMEWWTLVCGCYSVCHYYLFTNWCTHKVKIREFFFVRVFYVIIRVQNAKSFFFYKFYILKELSKKNVQLKFVFFFFFFELIYSIPQEEKKNSSFIYNIGSTSCKFDCIFAILENPNFFFME